MSKLSALLRSKAAIVALGQLSTQLCVFVRNLLIVRSLTPEAYGAASTLLISLTIVQSSMDFGLNRWLVQTPRGNEPEYQRNAHFASLIQGLVIASLLFLSGPLLAFLYDLPDMVGAYRTLAIVPLVMGLFHFDVYRVQREDRFGPSVVTRVAGQLVSLIVVALLLPYYDDYRIVLWSMVSIPVGSLLASHCLRERPFGFAADLSVLRSAFDYGWPLIVNGIFFVLVSQSDRFLIGSADMLVSFAQSILDSLSGVVGFSKADLAVYSVGFTIAAMPNQFVVGTLNTLLFPMMAGAQDDRPRLHGLYASGVRLNALLAALLAAGFILFGTNVLGILYGEHYRSIGAAVGVLAATQGGRLLRVPVFVAALALGDTRLMMYSNMFRALSVLGSGVVVVLGWPLIALAGVGLLTEFATIGVAIFLLRRGHGFRYRLSAGGVVFYLGSCAASLLLASFVPAEADVARFVLTVFVLAAIAIAAAIALKGVYREGVALLTSRGSRGEGA